MKTRKGRDFRKSLRKVLPDDDLDTFELIFKKSPALYNYHIDQTRQDLRVKNANIIMRVAGSANARAVEEYLRADKLRLIFMNALPIVRQSQYNARKGIESKERLY
jgi:hypothetical protein